LEAGLTIDAARHLQIKPAVAAVTAGKFRQRRRKNKHKSKMAHKNSEKSADILCSHAKVLT
jgi:hypothetical protein